MEPRKHFPGQELVAKCAAEIDNEFDGAFCHPVTGKIARITLSSNFKYIWGEIEQVKITDFIS